MAGSLTRLVENAGQLMTDWTSQWNVVRVNSYAYEYQYGLQQGCKGVIKEVTKGGDGCHSLPAKMLPATATASAEAPGMAPAR